METGREIRRARQGKGLSIDALAELAGTSRSTVHAIETNQLVREPDPDVLVRIARQLEAPKILELHCSGCLMRRELLSQQFPAVRSAMEELDTLKQHVDLVRRSLDSLALGLVGSGLQEGCGGDGGDGGDQDGE